MCFLRTCNTWHMDIAMRKKIVAAVIIMGFSGIVAQIVLLRELMIAFHGNELSIGIILANWLLLESAGAFWLGKNISRARKQLNWFIIVTILFSLFFVAAVYASRVFKDFLSAAPGEGLGIMVIFYVSFLILLPVSLLHGALFTSGCNLYDVYSTSVGSTTSKDRSDPLSIAKVYIYETLGTLAGGVIITYLFIPYIHSFKIAFILAFLNIGICTVLMKPFRRSGLPLLKRATGFMPFVLLALILFVLISPVANNLNLSSAKKQWSSQNLVHYQNTNYGNIVVV